MNATMPKIKQTLESKTGTKLKSEDSSKKKQKKASMRKRFRKARKIF